MKLKCILAASVIALAWPTLACAQPGPALEATPQIAVMGSGTATRDADYVVLNGNVTGRRRIRKRR